MPYRNATGSSTLSSRYAMDKNSKCSLRNDFVYRYLSTYLTYRGGYLTTQVGSEAL